jgi:hypothetical protein
LEPHAADLPNKWITTLLNSYNAHPCTEMFDPTKVTSPFGETRIHLHKDLVKRVDNREMKVFDDIDLLPIAIRDPKLTRAIHLIGPQEPFDLATSEF